MISGRKKCNVPIFAPASQAMLRNNRPRTGKAGPAGGKVEGPAGPPSLPGVGAGRGFAALWGLWMVAVAFATAAFVYILKQK